MKKERIYVCHTFYHVYIAVLKECNLPLEKRGHATLVLSTMSNDFGNLQERAQNCGLFEQVVLFEEKEDTFFPELMKYHKDRGNIFFNMLARIRYTKLFGKLQEPYIPVNFKEYQDIYVFCDSDPIGYYLAYKKIYYHALEDGLNCISSYDTARYDNRGHFGLKAYLASKNLIFIQNGYSKYCLDMEVNDISILAYPCPKYIEKSRRELVEAVREEDKPLIATLFLEHFSKLEDQLKQIPEGKETLLVLTEPLCDLETRKRIFSDIIATYGENRTVILKPHPRDLLDYESIFSEHIVIGDKFPMEVMNLIPGLKIDRIVSVFTMLDAIDFCREKIYLGEDFMDQYEAPELHRQNEYI